MDVSKIASLQMRISRMPRALEALRTTTRMNLYLEVKTLTDKLCAGKFAKPDCGRVAMEVINQLCGEKAPPGTPLLSAEMMQVVADALADIKSGDSDLKVAASFMRWSRAMDLLMKLKNDPAEVDLKAAIALNPRNALAYCSMAYLAGFQGDSRRAIELGKKALELNPDLTEAWIELGNAYEATGEHNLALSAWEKAHSLNPDVMATRGPAPASGLPGRDKSEYEVLTDDGDVTR